MVKYLNNEFVANLLLSRLVKSFENRIIVSEVMAKSLVSCFLTHGVVLLCSASTNGCRVQCSVIYEFG